MSMTESEAIEVFRGLLDVPCEMLVEYASVATEEQKKALVRIRYAEEMAINALEKRIAKKPKTDDRYVMYICPCCNDFIKVSHNCCQNCGQKLDWSDEK